MSDKLPVFVEFTMFQSKKLCSVNVFDIKGFYASSEMEEKGSGSGTIHHHPTNATKIEVEGGLTVRESYEEVYEKIHDAIERARTVVT